MAQIFRPGSTGPGRADNEHTDPRVGVARRSILARDDFGSAVRIVEQLTAAGLPEGSAAVVGAELRSPSRQRGRPSTADVTGRGALSGLLIGAAAGWLLRLVDLTSGSLSTWWLVINTAVLGAVLGAAVALLGYVITEGRRTFTADDPVRAGRYLVLVDADVADRAVRLLQQADSGAAAAGGKVQS